LVRASVRDRKVVVHAARARLRLVHYHGAERGAGGKDDGDEGHVYDRDAEPARNPDSGQAPHERVQEERDQRRDQEEEDHVTRRPRNHPQQQQQQRETDELNPARDLEPRGLDGRPGHARHRSAQVVPLSPARPPRWEWDFELDGALALERRPVPSRGALQGQASFVTVPRMASPSGHAQAVRRRRAETAAARRTRRLVGLLLLAAVALITLLLTAFGSAGGDRPV